MSKEYQPRAPPVLDTVFEMASFALTVCPPVARRRGTFCSLVDFDTGAVEACSDSVYEVVSLNVDNGSISHCSWHHPWQPSRSSLDSCVFSAQTVGSP